MVKKTPAEMKKRLQSADDWLKTHPAQETDLDVLERQLLERLEIKKQLIKELKKATISDTKGSRGGTPCEKMTIDQLVTHLIRAGRKVTFTVIS